MAPVVQRINLSHGSWSSEDKSNGNMQYFYWDFVELYTYRHRSVTINRCRRITIYHLARKGKGFSIFFLLSFHYCNSTGSFYFNSELLDSGDSSRLNEAPSLPVNSFLRIFCHHPRSVYSLRRNWFALQKLVTHGSCSSEDKSISWLLQFRG